jgi:hypothetical protein|tara:strand:+ start:59 stop:550 length:492 start_codon:yes stop_codon:yes gene_type:complete
MNRGNPHKRESFLGPLNNRGMGRDRREPPKMYPGGPPRDNKMYPGGPPMDSQMRPMLAGGYDSGNRRPIRDGQGNLIPQRPVFGEAFPRTPTPNYIPIMDYTGSRTASMDPGSKYNGTYKQEGYGDPRFGDFGQEEDYDNDYYMDDVIDPGLSGYDRGPLYFS